MADRSALSKAGRRVAAVLHRGAPEGDDALDARVESIQDGVRARRRRRWIARGAAGAALTAATLGVLALVARRAPDLAFRVDGERGELGRFIAATGTGTRVEFDDGSRLLLRSDARARVVATSPQGARVVLEDGALTADVVHRADTAWTLTAGPFDVHVVGTSFEAAWSPDDEALSVVMREGSVEITGACVAQPVRLEAGAARVLSCRGVTRDPAREPSPRADSSAPVPSTRPDASGSPSASAGAAPGEGVGWRALARRGDFKAAYAELEGSGALARLEGMDAAELLAVADVARLAGHADVARTAFSRVRSAFAGTEAAATAAFQLGRASSGADAARWLRLYLDERPNGAFAREALGRLLELEAGAPTAPALAARYLSLYPDGPHAALARSIATP